MISASHLAGVVEHFDDVGVAYDAAEGGLTTDAEQRLGADSTCIEEVWARGSPRHLQELELGRLAGHELKVEAVRV